MASAEKVRSDVAKRTLANLKNFRVSIFGNDYSHRLIIQTNNISLLRIRQKINNNFDSSAFI
jgi:hypothetical protein